MISVETSIEYLELKVKALYIVHSLSLLLVLELELQLKYICERGTMKIKTTIL